VARKLARKLAKKLAKKLARKLDGANDSAVGWVEDQVGREDRRIKAS
jgi:hypothetical protein